MKFVKSGGKTATGPTDWFTGTVYIDGIQSPNEDSRLSCAHVRFTAGARTVWHTHPMGQTLYVTDGIGYVGARGGEVHLGLGTYTPVPEPTLFVHRLRDQGATTPG